jgi:hypothetical protein
LPAIVILSAEIYQLRNNFEKGQTFQFIEKPPKERINNTFIGKGFSLHIIRIPQIIATFLLTDTMAGSRLYTDMAKANDAVLAL